MRAVVRSTPERRRADDWWLALASAGLDSRIDSDGAAYLVSVPETDRDRAHAVLDAFDEENRAPAPAPPSEPVRTRAGLALAVAICAFFVVTGPRDTDSVWFERGAAVASRIATGELWRCVTALTLHADFPHVVGNAVMLVLFGTALCAALGAGTAVWVMLLAGAAGNWLSATLHGAPYGSVGASTSVFAVVGALAALQAAHRRRGVATSAWRAWAPIAAGLALLAFLGTGPRSDLLAHLFGFGAGALLGTLAIAVERYRDRPMLQRGLAFGALVTVVVCWLIALISS